MVDNLMKFTGTEDPVLSRPFTVIDPQGSAWGIASDKIWFIASKGKNFPRFRGASPALMSVLKLLKGEPADFVEVSSEIQSAIEGCSIVSVLGVPVSQDRINTLIQACPCKVRMWNASSYLGVPSLGFYSVEWRAYLMGYENVLGEVPESDLRLEDDERSLFRLAMSL